MLAPKVRTPRRMTSGAESNHARTTTPSAPLALDHRRTISALIHIIAIKLSAGSSRVYRTHFKLGTTEWRIMALLFIQPGISPQTISDTIGFDKAAISRSIKILQKRKIAVAEPDARRSRFLRVTLTEHGRQLHDRIVRVALEREQRFVSCLSKDEADVMLGLLMRLLEMVPQTNAPLSIDGPVVRSTKKPR